MIAKENVLSASANRHLQKYLKLRGENMASQVHGSKVGMITMPCKHSSLLVVRCICLAYSNYPNQPNYFYPFFTMSFHIVLLCLCILRDSQTPNLTSKTEVL